MNKFWKWTIKVILGFIAFIILLIIIAAINQYISNKIDEKKYPPPGKIVDIGGYRLHLNCSGKKGPSVVLDSGLGDFSLTWYYIQPQIAKFTHVCSYDRAGLGWSDKGPNPRTSIKIAQELHTLLHNANVKPPYVLVGHSLGGLNMQVFANLYPNEVAGLILLDSSHENQEKFLQKLRPGDSAFQIKIKMFWYLVKPIWLPKTLAKYIISEDVPKEISSLDFAISFNTKNSFTNYEESKSFTKDLPSLKNDFLKGKPLIVISGGKYEQIPGTTKEEMKKIIQVWMSFQNDLVSKSQKGQHWIAENSGHMIPLQEPQIVVKAVKEMVKEIREPNIIE
ncbi:MAG: putative aminoacrylate hydrolase RutD [Candidatus Anoxychlamydiales bacterium]|nr:putative aminoacrylate hydrolase RutD [Candidatus Anoxychlamydiales bacterium]